MNADRFVLDSSVAVAWFFPDTESERLYAASVLRMIDEGATANVPVLFHIEVAEFLLRKRRTRRARFSQPRLDAAFDDLDGLGLETVIVHALYRDVAGWAQEYHVQVKDAPFVHLAVQNRIPLATLDGGQRQALRSMNMPLVVFNQEQLLSH